VKTAFAIACHPDDMEFMMSGTLLLLKDAGYEIHCMNIANGGLGSNVGDSASTARIRKCEAVESAKIAGAIFHESLCDDLEVFYDSETLAKLVPIVRNVRPEIILTHGPFDYMEDHVNTGRLAVGAAFCMGMKNFKCANPENFHEADIAVYHSMPHGLRDQLGRKVSSQFFIDVSSKIELKRRMLECHKSQCAWLNQTQKISYLEEMENGMASLGKMSGKFELAEGWTRHNPLGLSGEKFRPLEESLKSKIKSLI